jgi:UDP-2-acetamido-3-amino-2,3-dideoxy-glucuronate N-acetyltransferase
MLKKDKITTFLNRGLLIPVEFSTLPFVPQRVFTVSHVPDMAIRGEHAHKTTKQYLICLEGRVELAILNEEGETEFDNLDAGEGFFLDSGIYAGQRYRLGAILLVLASTPYDPSDYISDKDEYLKWKAEQHESGSTE